MVSQTTEAVGNTVDAHGKNFWDAYLEMIEKTEMVFDEGGNHNYQMVLNPKTAEKLRENPPTEEQKQRIQEAINLKRKEYYERRPTRKLSWPAPLHECSVTYLKIISAVLKTNETSTFL